MLRTAALVALLVCAAANARVPSRKTVLPAQTGARVDITVPYTTNGTSTLGVFQGVAPKVIASPFLDDGPNPAFQKVYNLQYYGSRLGSSSKFNAATDRPPNNLRGNR